MHERLKILIREAVNKQEAVARGLEEDGIRGGANNAYSVLVGMEEIERIVKAWLDTLCPECHMEMEQPKTGEWKWACYDCFHFQGERKS